MAKTLTFLSSTAPLFTLLLYSCAQAIPLPINFSATNHAAPSVPASAHVDITRIISLRSQIPVKFSRKTLSRSTSNQQNRNFEMPQDSNHQRSLDSGKNNFVNTLQITHVTRESAPTSRRKRFKRVDKQVADLASAQPNQDAEPHAAPATTNATTQAPPAQTDNSNASVDEYEGEEEQRAEDDNSPVMNATSMLGKARSKGGQFVNGGFVEFIEWLFVFILVAPGTFPAIGCVLLTCTNFWRRRLVGSAAESPVASRTSEDVDVDVDVDVEIITNSASSNYQHVTHVDHAALVARPRKGTTEEGESQT